MDCYNRVIILENLFLHSERAAILFEQYCVPFIHHYGMVTF